MKLRLSNDLESSMNMMETFLGRLASCKQNKAVKAFGQLMEQILVCVYILFLEWPAQLAMTLQWGLMTHSDNGCKPSESYY